jgi:hypothetical protein
MQFSIPRRLIAVSITAGVLLLAPATALAWDGRGRLPGPHRGQR